MKSALERRAVVSGPSAHCPKKNTKVSQFLKEDRLFLRYNNNNNTGNPDRSWRDHELPVM
ncbi:hypothetical protein UF75_4930 [Desulfosporosinus sp. I2]|nr:hypothetical protein UF75_4930 [Desulfosporosinus sp. I2]